MGHFEEVLTWPKSWPPGLTSQPLQAFVEFIGFWCFMVWSSTWNLILGTLRGGVNMTEELTSRFNLTTSSGFSKVHKVLVFHGMEFILARDTLRSCFHWKVDQQVWTQTLFRLWLCSDLYLQLYLERSRNIILCLIL